jgi:glutamyl-Q tRNA(Asp) synthetase
VSIRRKDGLFAYNLAVVVDDIYQNVTHIVRGADLIDTTIQQNYLYQLFNKPSPIYFHLPVICNEPFKKLSKQNHAEAVNPQFAVQNLFKAFRLIGLPTTDLSNKVSANRLVEWAVINWSPKLLVKRREILFSDINAV